MADCRKCSQSFEPPDVEEFYAEGFGSSPCISCGHGDCQCKFYCFECRD